MCISVKFKTLHRSFSFSHRKSSPHFIVECANYEISNGKLKKRILLLIFLLYIYMVSLVLFLGNKYKNGGIIFALMVLSWLHFYDFIVFVELFDNHWLKQNLLLFLTHSLTHWLTEWCLKMLPLYNEKYIFDRLENYHCLVLRKKYRRWPFALDIIAISRDAIFIFFSSHVHVLSTPRIASERETNS